MSDIDFLTAKVRGLENENRALRETMWDGYFKAACAATLHRGKVSGVSAAAEIADEMMRVREARKQ